MIHCSSRPLISMLRHPFHLVVLLLIATLIACSTLLTSSTPGNTAATHTSIRIMPLGDSITYGVGSSAFGGYRVGLWRNCQQNSWSMSYVGSQISGPMTLPDRHNEGHPGWRIDQLAKQVDAWLRTYQPQIILLHIGTNDIIQNYKLSTAPERLQALLQQITTISPHAVIIVAQIIPLYRRADADTQVRAYNSKIPALVQGMVREGKHVTYVNMHDVIPGSDFPDAIHPNDHGYQLMVPIWYKALQEVLNTHGALHSWARLF